MSMFGGVPVQDQTQQTQGSRFGGIAVQQQQRQPTPQEQSEMDDVMAAPLAGPTARVVRQGGQGMFSGVAGLPGLPVDLASGVGNFIHRQMGEPEVPLSETPLRDWGSEGWSRAAERATGATNNGNPQTESERLARKAGTFVGASAPFGLRAAALAPEAFVGSEMGRVADQNAPEWTRGYGEFAGGVVGPGVRPAVRGAVTGTRAAITGAAPEALAPAKEALSQEAGKAFDTLRNSNVIVTPTGLTRLAGGIRSDLAGQGYTPKLQAGIGAVLDELNDKISGGNVTYQDMINLRRIAQSAGQGPVAHGQGFLSGKIVDHIDDFLDTLHQRPSDFLAGGDPQLAAQTLQTANSAWRRFKKADALDQAVQRGLENAGPHVGNVEGSISTQLKGLVRGKAAKQFSPVEREAIRRIVHGDSIQNVLRFMGKASPENWISGLAELYGTLGALHNPVAAAASVGAAGAGFLARRAAGARTNMKINALSEQLRRGNGQVMSPPSAAPRPMGAPPPGPMIPPSHQLPPPQRRSPVGATMYSNPLDPAAIKALFFKGRPPSASPPAQGTAAARPAGQTAAEYARDNKLAPRPEDPGITAYHGTPHDFDNFDSSRIGTGEGAQAYGHGLYFAENEKIAQGYRDALTRNQGPEVIFDGRQINVPAANVAPWKMKPEELAAFHVRQSANAGPATLKSLEESARGARRSIEYSRERLRNSPPPKVAAELRSNINEATAMAGAYDRAAAWLRVNGDRIRLGPDVKAPGKVFQVAIKARPEEFLDWDKPLAHQSPVVSAALRKLGFASEKDFAPQSDLGTFAGQQMTGAPVTGAEIYNRAVRGRTRSFNQSGASVKTPAEAAQVLQRHGIKGIRYRDAGSRGADVQTPNYNYVIFDDKLISVLKKYAIPMTVTAGGVIVAGGKLPPEIKAQLES